MKPENVFLRAVSGVLAAVMTFGAGLSEIPQHSLTVSAEESNAGDISVTANNPLGALLLAKTEEVTETDDFSGGYGISEIEVQNHTAFVSYYAEKNCEIVLGFYSDDGTQMYASCSQTLTPDTENTSGGNDTAEIVLPENVPEFYLLKGYLVDSDCTPLCEAFTTEYYTEGVTAVRNSTVSDFDENLVVNLDESMDTNFLVLSEHTIQIPYNGKTNLLDSYDESAGIYVFSSIDENISGLTAGDVVFYDYDDGNLLTFTVTEIEIDQSSAVIHTDLDMELTDAVDLVKIEMEDSMLPENLEPGTDLGDGLTYLGLTEDSASEQPSSQNYPPLSKAVNTSGQIMGIGCSFKWEGTFPENDKEKVSGGRVTGKIEGTVSLNIGFKAGLKYQVYINTSNWFAKLSVSPSVSIKGELGVTASVSVLLAGVMSDLKLLKVELGPSFVIEGSVSASLSLTVSQETAVQIEKGKKKIQVNSKKPELEGSFEGSFGAFVGLQFKAEVKVLDSKVNLTARAGATVESSLIKFSATVSEDGVETENSLTDILHSCEHCFDGTVSLIGKVSASYQLTKKSPKVTATFLDIKRHLFDFYYSHDNKEFGFGDCPKLKFRVSFHVADSSGKPVGGASVNITTLNEKSARYVVNRTLTTDENGDVSLFMNSDKKIEYQYHIEKDHASAENIFNIYGAKRDFNITLDIDETEDTTEPPETEPASEDPTESAQTTEPESTETADTNSGTCGENVTWKLDSDGLLTISGNGDMFDFYPASCYVEGGFCAPWVRNRWGNKDIVKIVIENGVTSIGANAFEMCTSLTSVIIPDSVTSIGIGAFEGCTNLTSVTIPDSVTSIETDVFKWCENLTSVTIPDSVTAIEWCAFMGCTSLTSVTIPDSVTSIGMGAFKYCTNLTSVTIPDSVTSIEHSVFNGCSNLNSLYISEQNSFYASVDGILYNKEITELLSCPDIKTSVIIPDSVTSIGIYAFSYCTNLTSVTIPNSVTSISALAFYECKNLTSVTIPDSVTSIGEHVFAECISLASVTIPSSVTEIEWEAFLGCTNLTSVTIPNSVTSIGGYAFTYCTNLKDVYYAGTEEQWNKISIASYNDCLTNAAIHYNSGVSEVNTLSYNAPMMQSTKNISYSPLAGASEIRTAVFEGLTAGAVYNFYSMVSRTAENPLDSENLLYINQYTADENGTLTVSYIPALETQTAEEFVMLLPEKETLLLGDLDGDEKSDASDAAKVLLAAAKQGSGQDTGLTEAQKTAADVNSDGQVNASDAAYILRYAAEKGAGTFSGTLSEYMDNIL